MQVIAASGEKNASVALRSAADVISGNPAAMQLRYLRIGTDTNIRVGRNRKIEFGSWKMDCRIEGPIGSHHEPSVPTHTHKEPSLP